MSGRIQYLLHANSPYFKLFPSPNNQFILFWKFYWLPWLAFLNFFFLKKKKNGFCLHFKFFQHTLSLAEVILFRSFFHTVESIFPLPIIISKILGLTLFFLMTPTNLTQLFEVAHPFDSQIPVGFFFFFVKYGGSSFGCPLFLSLLTSLFVTIFNLFILDALRHCSWSKSL